MKLFIKHMVCDRCKRVVRQELEALGIQVNRVTLGEADVEMLPKGVTLQHVRQVLEANGFDLLDDRRSIVIEQVKTSIINEIHHDRRERPVHQNLSEYLSQKTGYDYSYLSHLFSTSEGITIEKFVIAQKIEKVKEYLNYDELTLSEIAWRLGYSSSQHLSNQFRQVVGMTPGQFRKEAGSQRVALDVVGKPK